jgi:hypothetical protein
MKSKDDVKLPPEDEPEALDADTAPEIRAPELSPEERERIAAEVAKQINSELSAARELTRRELIKQTTAIELQRQRLEAGLTSAKDDLIEFMIDVAPFADDLRWDGKIYQQGQWIKAPRHIYDSMREAMARSWDADDRAMIQAMRHRGRRDPMTMPMNTMQREMRMPDGSFTLFHDTRINGRTGAVSHAPGAFGGTL